MKWTRTQFGLNAICALMLGLSLCGVAHSGETEMWFEQAPRGAGAWANDGLPVGNGFLGAMVYGGPALDRIQINEHTVWRGGPGTEEWIADPNNPNALEQLPIIRQALLDGDYKKAEQLSKQHLRATIPHKSTFGAYVTLGEFTIATGHQAYSDLRRELDLATGVASVCYVSGGQRFTREVFASYPSNCLVFRYAAEEAGSLDLELKFVSPHPIRSEADGEVWKLSGEVAENGLALDTRVAVLNEGGRVQIEEGRVTVADATTATFIVIMGTDYENVFPHYRGAHPAEANRLRLEAARELGFEQLLAAHIADHSALFDRATIDLPGDEDGTLAALPLDKRIERLKEDPEASDSGLMELLFQYGRYLMIASSRPGSLPANLQGVWCNSMNPPWQSDYHMDINLQMNYWPAGPANLLECQLPLIDYTDKLREPGARTAEVYFGAEGWTVNLLSNIWGFTAPPLNHHMYWSYFPSLGPWLATHVWEHYAFSKDSDFLREQAWPILEGAARFSEAALYRLPDGDLSVTPSWSPEHGIISKGATAGNSIFRELLLQAAEAGRILGQDEAILNNWRKIAAEIVPFKIGRFGQLQEWYEDVDDPDNQHRHINHFFGIYPGSQIDPERTPELAAAIATDLERRGLEGTGWSRAWAVSVLARLRDGDFAEAMLRDLVATKALRNLWMTTSNRYQIDGNFGACAGIAEMLIQSRYWTGGGEVTLLPALPAAWAASGSFQGLRARGAFVVDCEWKDGQVTRARIHAEKGGQMTLHWNGQKKSWILEPGQTLEF